MRVSAGSTTYENAPAGTYAAVCTQIVDLGTQESEWNGAVKVSRKVRITWELNEMMSDGRPFTISREFTAGLYEKGLKPFLEMWRGRAFTPEELKDFGLDVLAGKGCMLSVVEYTKMNGNIGVKVGSASKLPKGMEAPAPVGEVIVFTLAEFSQATFDKLSNWVKEQIQKSPEYQSLKGTAQTGTISGMTDEEDVSF